MKKTGKYFVVSKSFIIFAALIYSLQTKNLLENEKNDDVDCVSGHDSSYSGADKVPRRRGQ